MFRALRDDLDSPFNFHPEDVFGVAGNMIQTFTQFVRPLVGAVGGALRLSAVVPTHLAFKGHKGGQQILLNACVNACDAIPNGGSLAIHAENVTEGPHAGQYVRNRVTDTGQGIPLPRYENGYSRRSTRRRRRARASGFRRSPRS